MNRTANEPNEHRVPVGPHTSSGYPEWKTFRGAKVGEVHCRLGQKAAELEEVGCRLFSEEELRKERPEVADLILERL